MKKSLVLKAIVFALVAVYFALGLWAFIIEPSSLVTRRVTLQIPNWRPELQGMKVAMLTDLHVGSPYIGIEKIKQVVARTNAERPDLVVLLGDFVIHNVVGGRFVKPAPVAEALKGLLAPLGVVAVLGNHDWWYDGPRITRALRQAGIVVLENEAYRIQFNGKPVWIVGIADAMTRSPDVVGPLQQVSDSDPIILITHNPDLFFRDIPSRVSLTLAGHTHGGQVNLPLLGRLIVPSYFGQRYAIGHVVEGGRHLFVSSGIGTSILPVRFRVPPEIVILTLQSK